MTKRKYNRGREIPLKWVVGLYDATEKRGYVEFVQDRTSSTLESLILKHVLPGTEIWTDEWKGYKGLGILGGVSPYIHKAVCHAKYFKDPTTGVCTNYVEGYWSQVKQYYRRFGVMSSVFVPEYVDQFLWNGVYGRSVGRRFQSMIELIREKYPL